MKRLYLAYGSNLNLSQMIRRCPTARLIGTASLEGWSLVYKGSKSGAYLTMISDKHGKTPVAIWELKPEDENALDIYEGYPRFYFKQDIKVGDLDCFAYLMDLERTYGLPALQYINTCKEGYYDMGFDESILDEAFYRTLYKLQEDEE